MLTGTKLCRSLITAAIWLAIWSSGALAHGGIAGPDELGPPVITATALGIAGYWTVMLWPSRRKSGERTKGNRRPQTKFNRKANGRY
jgi:hypothetical protein